MPHDRLPILPCPVPRTTACCSPASGKQVVCRVRVPRTTACCSPASGKQVVCRVRVPRTNLFVRVVRSPAIECSQSQENLRIQRGFSQAEFPDTLKLVCPCRLSSGDRTFAMPGNSAIRAAIPADTLIPPVSPLDSDLSPLHSPRVVTSTIQKDSLKHRLDPLEGRPYVPDPFDRWHSPRAKDEPGRDERILSTSKEAGYPPS
jgi:hypothetical protein